MFKHLFFAPHMKKLIAESRCSECGTDFQEGQSAVKGRKILLCFQCIRMLKTFTRF